jgi:hypothetical protein
MKRGLAHIPIEDTHSAHDAKAYTIRIAVLLTFNTLENFGHLTSFFVFLVA